MMLKYGSCFDNFDGEKSEELVVYSIATEVAT